MSESEADNFLLTLNFSGEELIFSSTEELNIFLQNQRDSWGWLQSTATKTPNSNSIWNIYGHYFKQITAFIFDCSQPHARQDSLIKNIMAATLNAVQKGFIYSDSAAGQFILSLKDKSNASVAIYALAFLTKQEVSFNSIAALEGAFSAYMFEKNITDTVEFQQKSLVIVKNSWARKFGEQFKDLNKEKVRLIDEVNSLKTEFETSLRDFKDKVEQQELSHSQKVAESEARLADIEHTYDEKLALQSSVQYWTKKCKQHRFAMWALGVFTIVLAVSTGIGFVIAAYIFLEETVLNVPLWKLGIMIGISSFGVWITRLFAKIFIANLHLKTDADERVTMIQTYLALLREGNGPQNDERQLILQTLFRPSTTGFIKDEGPAMFYESILKINKP